MKKSGKVLSLVLSLALVASSIPMAFANAATTAPAGPTVTSAGKLTYGNEVVGSLNGTANTYTLTATDGTNKVDATAVAAAKDAFGKSYYRLAKTSEGQQGTICWSSSDTTVATIGNSKDKVEKLADDTPLKNQLSVSNIGTTTITATFQNVKLYDRDFGDAHAHFVVVPSITATQVLNVIKDKTGTPTDNTKYGIVFNNGKKDKDGKDILLKSGKDSLDSANAQVVADDTALAAMTALPTANNYKLEDGSDVKAPTDDLYYTISNLSNPSAASSLCIYGKTSVTGSKPTEAKPVVTSGDVNANYVVSAPAGVAIGTYKTMPISGSTYAVPYIGSFVVTAYTDKPSAADAKIIAAVTVTVGKDYTDAAATGKAVTVKNTNATTAVPSGFNTSYTTETVTDDTTTPIWDLTGYNVTSAGDSTVAVTGNANLASITAAKSTAITVDGNAVVSGGVTGDYATAAVTVDGNHTSVGTVIGKTVTVEGGAKTGSIFGATVLVNGNSANGKGTTVAGDVDAATSFTAFNDAVISGDLHKPQGFRDNGTVVKATDSDYATAYPENHMGGKVLVGDNNLDSTPVLTCATVNGKVWAADTVTVKGTSSVVTGDVTAANANVTVSGATVGGSVDAGTGDVTVSIFQAPDGSYVAPKVGSSLAGKNVTVSGNVDSKATPQISGTITSTDGVVKISGANVKAIKAGNVAAGEGSGNAAVTVFKSTTGDITLNNVKAAAVAINNSTVGNIHNDGYLGTAALTIDGSTVGDVYSASPVTVSASALNSTTTVGKLASEANVAVGSATDQGNITVAALHDAIGDDLSSTEIVDPVAFNVYQNGNNNTVAVSDITARTPYDANSTNKTALTAFDIKGTYANLSNFSALSFDGQLSDVTVTSAFKTPSLTVINGKFSVPQFDTDSYTGSSAAQVTLTDMTAPSKVNKTISGVMNLSIPAGAVGGTKVLTYDALMDATSFVPQNFTTDTAVYDSVAKTDTMVVKAAAPIALTGITLTPATSEVEVGGKATLTVNAAPAGAKLPADAKATSWTVDNTDNFTVTPAADGLSATVAAKGFSTDAAKNKGTVTVNVTADGKAYTATAAVTAKQAVVPKNDNFSVDSLPAVMKVGQAYQVAIKSKDGTKPTLAFGNGGSGASGAVITSKSTKGNTTYIKFTAAREGKFGLYVSGTNEEILTVKGNVCDTAKVTVKAGGTYQFKVSVTAWPTFAIAGVGTYKPTSSTIKSGNIDCFYKVSFKGAKTGTHGVYANGVLVGTVTVA